MAGKNKFRPIDIIRDWCASPSHQSSLDTEQIVEWGAINFLDTKFPTQSAKKRVTVGQKWLLLIVFVAIIALTVKFPIATIVGLNAIFIGHSLLVLTLRAVLLYYSATGGTETNSTPIALDDAKLPIITVLCPMYKEASCLPGLIGAISSLDYPSNRLDVRLVLEADDTDTISAALAIDLPSFIRIVRVPASEPRTKPKACNYALWQAKGEIIVIFDAEDRPAPGELREAANAFANADERVCCFQARLSYYNRKESILTRLFAIEYALLFDLILPGLDRIGAPLPLGGTSNFFRTRQLIEIGGWDPYNVTEDADLGMRMAAAGFSSKVLDATTYEEATSQVWPWLKQRSRWIKGYLQTWLVHCRRGKSRRGWKFFLTLHLLIASVVIAALFNPLYWTFYACWLFGAEWTDPFFPAPLDGLATFSLLAGNFFHIWLFMLAPMRRRWHDLVPFALLAPFYWLLQSVAGIIALWQFFVRPFFWEKTSHGPGKPLDDAMLAASAPDGP